MQYISIYQVTVIYETHRFCEMKVKLSLTILTCDTKFQPLRGKNEYDIYLCNNELVRDIEMSSIIVRPVL